MAPQMPNLSKRMTANPARPVARYRPGKAVPEEPSSEEDDSDQEAEKQPLPKQAQPKATSFPAGVQRRPTQARVVQQAEEEDEEGFVTEDEDEDGDGQVVEATSATGRDASKTTQRTTKLQVEGKALEEDLEKFEKDGSSSQKETDDEDDGDESSSDEEIPKRVFQRPTFIKKSERDRATSSDAVGASATGGKITTNTFSNQHSSPAEETRRKEMASQMIKESLERDAAARAAGRKGWDYDDEVAPEDTVDDTDGVDPEAEYAAWKLRELKRLKRDRESIEQREKTIEEIERRRNLTQGEREIEDREFLERQKEEREEGKGKAGFLQRYHHKGAFFQDDETAELLRKRDLMGAKFVDEVKNREALPQHMQLRDMTKLGKKGKTRYTDLRGEDTGKWGQGYVDKDRQGPRTAFDIDERFRPDHDGSAGGGTKGPTGANASTIRDRRVGNVEGAANMPRAMQDGHSRRSLGDQSDSYRPSRQSRERSPGRDELPGRRRSPSLTRRASPLGSKSPSHDRFTEPRLAENENAGRKKRTISPHREGDKRRRMEAS